MDKKELVTYLDSYLKSGEFQDNSRNGLQVDTTSNEIKKIGYSVDASTYIFQKAKEAGVDIVLCHHGLFWGYEQILVGVPFERAKALIEANIGLYASHIPLDAHEEVGNNIGLLKGFCNIFGIQESDTIKETFGEYKGKNVGWGLRFTKPLHIAGLQTLFADTLQLTKKLYNFGEKQNITSICFVSGQGAKCALEAKQKGYDVLVTGEAVHSEILGAKELHQSIFLGGHYETEKIGPKLLAHHLENTFKIETVFLDEKY